MLELRHLRYFIAVADHLNFSRAAEALETAQPSLSQQIRQLEAEVGVELFSRDKRQIALTPAGEAFLIDARALLTHVDTAVEHAHQAERGLRGELRIGYTPAAMLTLLPQAIRAFRIGRPDVRITLAALTPIALIEALRRREIDAGVLLERRDAGRLAGLDARRIGKLPFAAAVPLSHRLAERRTIRLEDIGTDTLILYARRLADIYDVVMNLCRERGFTPARVAEVDEVDAVLGLVAAGEGISIGPRMFAKANFPGIVFPAITPAPTPFCLVVARNPEARSRLAEAFVTTCVRTNAADAT